MISESLIVIVVPPSVTAVILKFSLLVASVIKRSSSLFNLTVNVTSKPVFDSIVFGVSYSTLNSTSFSALVIDSLPVANVVTSL